MLINGVDTSGEMKDADFIAKQMMSHIEAFGSQNPIQVVTDSAGNMSCNPSSVGREV